MNEEESAIAELMAMSDSELDMVSYEIKKWCCSGKKCNGYTRVRDYGIAPTYYHKKMYCNNEDSLLHKAKIPFSKWHDVTTTFLMCSKCFKKWKHLVPLYGEVAVNEKLFNPDKIRIIEN